MQPYGRKWIGQKICGHFKSFDNFAGQVSAVSITAADDTGADASLMAMPCSDGTVQVAALETYQPLYSLSRADCDQSVRLSKLSQVSHAAHKVLAAFSPCRQWLATVGCNHLTGIQIWDAETGQLEAQTKPGLMKILSLQWKHLPLLGAVLASGDAAGVCKLYMVNIFSQ